MRISTSRLTAYLEDLPGSALLDRIGNLLPALYLAWALPVLLIVAVVMPPWQNADEPMQMLRIAQIADGGLLAHRIGNQSGGRTQLGIMQSVAPVGPVIQHPAKRVTLEMLAKAGLPRWGAPVPLAFSASAIYPPVLYIPTALGVAAAKWLGLSVVHGLIAARMLNALVSALIGALALLLARATRLALATLLVLPMTVALFAAATQDGPMIALTFAAVACVDNAVCGERDLTLPALLLAGIAVAAVITARLPYLPLAALPLVCARRAWRQAWFGFAAIAAAGMIWLFYTFAFITVPLRAGVDPAAQLLYLLHQPGTIMPLAIHTLIDEYGGLRVSFIGVLGWLDTVLPAWYYHVAMAMLLAAFVAATAKPKGRPWLALLICLLGAGGLFFAQYLMWTPVGGSEVQGVQGRYFIPLAAVLALAVPAWPPIGELLRRPVLAALLGYAVITPMVIIHALVLRYYLVP